ncbi:MAG TPA: hypothetical protein VGI65_08460 [Steroidobacteraceae bacterium]|jgi:hypothetical protein
MEATAVSGLQAESRDFYVWMAGVFVLIAFGGFMPTYWLKVATGTFHGAPIFHVHGFLLFSWTCFFFVQTALVAAGRTLDHRTWGLAGIGLFSVMMCSILIGVLAAIKRDEAQGFGDAARRFSAVSLCQWPLLAGFFVVAIANIKKPQVHKRLMLLLMVGLMTPALARVFLTLFAPPGAGAQPPAPFVSVPPALVAALLLVVPIVRDWRNLGRVHPVYLYGGSILLAQQMLAVPIAATAAWMHIAKAFESLAG